VALSPLPASVAQQIEWSGTTSEDKLLSVVEGAIYGEIHSDVTEGGTRVIVGYVSDKWITAAEDGFRWLAEQGCGIEAQFSGEDEYQWRYDIPTKSFMFAETALTSVPEQDVAIADVAKTIITLLNGVDTATLTSNSMLNDALRRLVAASQ
jgi:hypothetical protein